MNTSVFKSASDKELGSVVCLTVRDKERHLTSRACAIPPSFKVAPNYATLILALPTGSPANLITLGDLFKTTLPGNQYASCYIAVNGDYPIDEGAMLKTDTNR